MRNFIKTILITSLIFCFSVSNAFADIYKGVIKDDVLVITGGVFNYEVNYPQFVFSPTKSGEKLLRRVELLESIYEERYQSGALNYRNYTYDWYCASGKPHTLMYGPPLRSYPLLSFIRVGKNNVERLSYVYPVATEDVSKPIRSLITLNIDNKKYFVNPNSNIFYLESTKSKEGSVYKIDNPGSGEFTGAQYEYEYNSEGSDVIFCSSCGLRSSSVKTTVHTSGSGSYSGTWETTSDEWSRFIRGVSEPYYVTYAYSTYERSESVNYRDISQVNLGVSTINLKNCTAYNITLAGNLIIDGGTYGFDRSRDDWTDKDLNNFKNGYSSALDSNNIIVNKGVIIDKKRQTSKYQVGVESEPVIVEDGDFTITTIKLSNPPIIIDWGDMPPLDINWDGLDLDFDFNAPTIEVTRNPSNQKQPAASVTLTIRATDPDGNDSPTPISINGGTFVASPATYTAREKEVVNISARDSKGNVRDYSVNISNIDTEAPYVTSMTQSNTVWTKTPVVVTVKAEDDVKLHATPYKYEFTPNSTGHTTVSGWTANRTFSATENGTLRVGVRDTLYTNDSNTEHFSWSEPYYIRNIDKISPSATVAYSVPSSQKVSEKVGVTVYVTPVDNADSVTGESSGISNTPIAWTEGAFTAQLEKTFYANGTYYFWIKDALGNISARQSVTINQIVSDNTTKPVINSLSQNKTTGQVSAPVTITVNASKGPNGPNLSNQPFSWDGGVTWTNNPNFNVNNNGNYTVIVKDTNGNTTEQSITISNIDYNKPTASLFLYKGQPEDWDMAYGPALVTDYVWKLRVEANDLGSGLQQVVTNWDNRTINTPSTPFTTVFDVTEPGVYGVKVVDKCGNETYVEKTITAESIGAGIWGVGGGSTGGTGTGMGGKGFGTIIDVPSTGSAGSSIFPGGASLQDLVFSPNSVYNIATGEIKGYPPGKAGIPIHLLFTATRNHYVTGTATFNGVEYPLYFPENGNANWIKSIGRQNVAEGFIPINTVTSDVKNGRIKISFKEYSDQSLSTLVSEGSATLYTSTQITKPTIGYVYNKATDQLTVNASTTVAGVDKVQVDLGSGYQDYTGPVTVGGASTIKVKVTDKAGNVSEITIDGSTLPMTGSSGGSIPTNDKDNVGATGSDGDTVNSYHTSNRSADIFIVGGNRSNTNSVPDSSIYDLTD